MSKAPLQNKNDQKKIWVHSVFILVLLHIPVKGHKKSLFLFAIVFLLLITVIVNGKGKVRLGMPLFCCFQRKRKIRKKRKKQKAKKKNCHVWFCPLCGRSRSGSATWEKFCLVYCYFVVSCLATVCNHGVEEIVWFDLLLVLLSTPFGFLHWNSTLWGETHPSDI